MSIAVLSDRIRHRFVFTLFPSIIAIVGFAILFHVHNNSNLQYGALFLAAAGAYSSMPVILGWFSSNREFLPSINYCMTDLWRSCWSPTTSCWHGLAGWVWQQ
jgi:hypothetical protein